MNKCISVRRVFLFLCVALTVVSFSGNAPADSIDTNYVVVDHQEVIPLESNFTNTLDGTATSYTRRGEEEFCVGYYVENGDIISGHSLLDGDGPVDFDLDLIVFDNNELYNDIDLVPGEDIIFNPVIATGSDTDIVIDGSIYAYDDSYGQNASDFSARGTMITATDYAKVTVDGMKIYTEGFVRAAFISDTRGQIYVKDSTVTVMGANPLTGAYDGYLNSADQNRMISPPWVLGIQGGGRLANMLGNYPTLTVVDSKVTSGAWGVLSTDAGNSFRMNVVDSKIEILPEKRGGMSSGEFSYSHKYGSGYGTYIIGNAQEYFYGTTFKGTTYASILTGGNAYYMSSNGDIDLYDAGDAQICGCPNPGPCDPADMVCDDGENRPPEIIETVAGAGNPTTIHSVFGFMAHNSGSINVLDGTEVQTEEATFLYKAGDVDFVADEAVLNPKSGIILQMIDNDDSTVGVQMGVPGYMGPVFNTEFFEDAGWPSENGNDVPNTGGGGPFGPPTPNNVALALTNGNYKGDVFNGTGYYTQLGDNLEVSIGEGATLSGLISLTETRHIDENGDQNTAFPIEEYYYLGHVENRNHRNGNSSISVALTNGGVWKVTGESLISSLTLDGGSIIGTKGYKVVMTVSDSEVPIEDGNTYTGDIVISLVKSK